MLTKDIKQTIDNARAVLVGKIPNPQSQIEQITIAMIYKFMDDMDIESVELGGKREFFVEELEQYAWSKIMSQQLGNQARMNLYTEALDKLQLSNRIPKLFRDIFKGAYLPFRDGQTLTLFLKEINDLSYNNSENLGNGFEYLLSIMDSQGDAGQFRTPRHIIDFIVNVVKPTKTDTILDPACGTAGFLISAYKYILKVAEQNKHNLTPKERKSLTENIQGYDISPDMVKLALVNMYLHKFKEPKIYEYDTLTQDTRWGDYFDCILANPPFMTPKGGIQPHNKFAIKANRSEVLFVDYIMEHLNSTGRAGIIVPEGIVFQSANAYKQLRKELIDGNYLYAVVSLPSGIFNPYSGVKTSILFIDKTLAKNTDKILFVEIQNDGFDLGAQRRQIDKNDLPKALELISSWQNCINTRKEFKTESKMATIVEKTKLAENEEYNLTSSRYRQTKDYSNCKWEMVKLGNICELYQPKTITQNDLLEDGCYYVYGANGIIGKYDKYNHEAPEVVVTCRGATCGTVNMTKEKCWITGNAMVVSPKLPTVSKTYLYYTLQHTDMNSVISGAAQPQITRQTLKELKIPLPPIKIQEEIVKELDGYQAVIDGAQKVIDNWKPTFQINPNWQKVKLGEVSKLTYGYTDTAKSIGDTRFIRITDIDNFGKIKNSDIKYINSTVESAKYELKQNDVIVARTGATYGKTALFREKYKAVYASFLIKIDFDNTKVYNPFYWIFTQTQDYTTQASKLVSGGAQPQFNANAIKNIEFYLPSLKEQRQIVLKIEQEEKVIEECKKLIKIQQEKINSKLQSIWGEKE